MKKKINVHKSGDLILQINNWNNKPISSSSAEGYGISTESVTVSSKYTDNLVNSDPLSVITKPTKSYDNRSKVGISTKLLEYFLTHKQEMDAEKLNDIHENFDFMSNVQLTVHPNPRALSIWKY